MTSIAHRYREIRRRMTEAAQGAGQPVDQARLIGVVKGQPAERVRAAYDAGLRDFAHSYMNEALAQAQLRASMPEARWHFIGALQSNKTRHLQDGWYRIHSVDRLKVARRLGQAEVLVQVKLGGEASKSGVEPAELPRLLQAIGEFTSVHVKGLMTLPPPAQHLAPEAAFGQLVEIANAAVQQGDLPAAPELSMGMSGDFEAAVAAGAHWVRVGQLLFGDRSRR